MLQCPSIRRFALHVAREFYFGRGKARIEGNLGAFVFGSNGRDFDVVNQGFTTPFMDDSNGGADLGIGKRGDILLEKIDQSAFSLQEREKLQRRAQVGLFRLFRRELLRQPGGLWRRLERRCLANLEDASREDAIEEHADEAGPGEPEPSGERKRGDVGHDETVTRTRRSWEFVAVEFMLL